MTMKVLEIWISRFNHRDFFLTSSFEDDFSIQHRLSKDHGANLIFECIRILIKKTLLVYIKP